MGAKIKKNYWVLYYHKFCVLFMPSLSNYQLRCYFTTTTHTKNLKFLQIWILSVFLCLSVFLSASPKHVFIKDIMYFCLSISVFVSLSFSPSVILVSSHLPTTLFMCEKMIVCPFLSLPLYRLFVLLSICILISLHLSTVYLSSFLSVSWLSKFRLWFK